MKYFDIIGYVSLTCTTYKIAKVHFQQERHESDVLMTAKNRKVAGIEWEVIQQVTQLSLKKIESL